MATTTQDSLVRLVAAIDDPTVADIDEVLALLANMEQDEGIREIEDELLELRQTVQIAQ